MTLANWLLIIKVLASVVIFVLFNAIGRLPDKKGTTLAKVKIYLVLTLFAIAIWGNYFI